MQMISFHGPTSIVGNAPLPNQVEYFNSMIQWAGDATTNMVFALAQTATGWALHTPYYLTGGSNTNAATGFLRNVTGNILFAGVNCGTTKIVGAYGDGVSNGSIIHSLAGAYIELRTALQDIGYRSTITKFKAYFSSFDSTSSMLISLVPNYTPYSVDGSGEVVLVFWTQKGAFLR
jgi:hypothetical protein